MGFPQSLLTEPSAAAAVSTGLLISLVWVAGICLVSMLIVMIPALFSGKQSGH